jgi:hypothetical protein
MSSEQRLQHLRDPKFSQDVLDKVGQVDGGALVLLPVISLSRCSSLASHCIMQPTENFSIVLLVNNITFWCILTVNNAFVIKENCWHHFHFALNLLCRFCSQRPWSLSLWWLAFCFWVVDPRFITGSYCFHEVCVLISIRLQISGSCKARLFLLDCQQLGTDFTESFMPKSSVKMDSTEPDESPNLSESSVIVNLQLSSMAECILLIISWFLLVERLPELPSLSTNVHPSLNCLNHSLTCVWPIALFPKAFWIIS